MSAGKNVESPKVEDTILGTIKKLIGIDYEYTKFDMDIILHINTAFSILSRISSVVKQGYRIIDNNNLWAEYTDDPELLSLVQEYLYEYCKIKFDPPTSSMVMEAMKESIKELEFSIEIYSKTKEDKDADES